MNNFKEHGLKIGSYVTVDCWGKYDSKIICKIISHFLNGKKQDCFVLDKIKSPSSANYGFSFKYLKECKTKHHINKLINFKFLTDK